MSIKDDNLAAVVSLILMLVVTVVGTSAVTVLALILCLLCARLVMTAFIDNIARSPAMHREWRKRFPRAAGTVDREMESRCVSVASDYAR